ncbi:hypothetical protein GCM10007036_47020 [Alsobacter metallidurans]|uniref:Uncharacterized protein n=1 Tax=Alsobacter metallidurans TaxID=340221 RepID=A0A917ID39_9HYPH|nr:hypothetical protein GCM10007036_47020 [Alsobacter metallidurans]
MLFADDDPDDGRAEFEQRLGELNTCDGAWRGCGRGACRRPRRCRRALACRAPRRRVTADSMAAFMDSLRTGILLAQERHAREASENASALPAPSPERRRPETSRSPRCRTV